MEFYFNQIMHFDYYFCKDIIPVVWKLQVLKFFFSFDGSHNNLYAL